ncbi:glycoside hydrolase domain-containing protein [Actinoplanes sp. TFC3]|uniref:glycoside hydrolase domain-containing protein n=1 Tax=Actinoplanes sp. TFC3 TaxID=1710355 RepID=UPI000833EA5B|nr:glycoside hydrolase domain-containing protein [Actinoplanes sp. TFC3]
MSAEVLAVQRWVNATYRTVTGYVVITEDGIPGSQTVNALTRALQHELGLTALADNFGPGTLTALTAHGPVGASEANKNIVFIVQGGCILKGYDPGTLDGVWGARTTSAIAAMMTDAGLAARVDGTLQPKVFKALLSTDSYLLVAGGSASVRASQQWLNDRYLNRSAFYVLSCDGQRGRNMLTALTFCLQYEAGLTDAQANGNFGPLTQSGLKANGLVQTGSTGPWVRLFSAALSLYPSAQTFTDTFTAALATQVKAFQRFVALAETGSGDFATWASLLISTGDQTRPATALDTIMEVTSARAAALKSAGYSLVGRYLTNVEGTSLDKKIKPGELNTLFGNGLRLFPIFQTANDSAGFFSFSQGYADALTAHDAAVGFGIDAGATIYFAVDFDATDANVDQGILPYFLGVAAGLRAKGSRYGHGNYGARNICSRLWREAFTLRSFVSGITSGWTGNMGYPLPDNWLLDQIATVDVGSGDGAQNIDRCVLRPYGDVGESATNSPAATFQEFLTWIDKLTELATAYGQGNADTLVLQYLRAGRHDTWQARQLNGATDEGFLAYVGARNVARIRTFRDPVAGVEIDTSRFGDATLGALQPGVRADFGGWGSDWVALYGDFKLNASGTSAADYASAKFAKSGAFSLAAFVADVDAHHAAAALRSGTRLAAHLRGTAPKSRFRRFFSTRFASNAATAAAAARDVLTSTADTAVTDARTRLLRGQASTPVPANDELTAFGKVFADRLVALAWAEAK